MTRTTVFQNGLHCVAFLALILCVLSGNLWAQSATGQKILSKIVDLDSHGKVTTTRSDFTFDENGLRLTNRVRDAKNRIIASESFRYSKTGMLLGREYVERGRPKWKWTNVRLNAELPVRNDIVNAKGKRIGWYVWTYDASGRLKKRERFEANGRLRFYYANIKFDNAGNYTEWTKFDSKGKKIGVKKWKYTKE